MPTPSTVPPVLDPVTSACGCGCACTCVCPPPAPVAPQVSGGPVRYASGEIVLSALDLKAKGFGFPWGHTRSFSNLLRVNTNFGNGYNWQVKEWTYLLNLG